MDVLGAVRKRLENHRLLEVGATIVVGVSGGVDSLCLLHVLKSLRSEFDWSIHVAHLNHCLRGTEADDDMIFVALLATRWELPCTIGVTDVDAVARRRRLSLEETARQVRYGFLADVAQQVGTSAVLVGHNADDQSETVLMHFLRGTGLAGLRGISETVDLQGLRTIPEGARLLSPETSIRLLRPLLGVPRTEIEQYCETYKLTPRFDRSNLDRTFFRNRLRHELLPLLETYNPNIKMLLRRTAAVAAADYELITSMRSDAWARVVREETESEITFDLAQWRALPLALQRASLRHGAFRLRPQLRDVEYLHIKQAVDIAANGSTGAQAVLPQSLRLTVGYETLRLASDEHSPSPPNWVLLCENGPISVAVPGETVLPNSNWRLEIRPWYGDITTIRRNPDRWTAYLDADQLGSSPMLRRRRPKDRFQPLGMGGQVVKVADFFINAKIPRDWREYIPLLVHRRSGRSDDEIAWIVGWRIAERVKVTPKTDHTLRLRWLRSQNPEVEAA